MTAHNMNVQNYDLATTSNMMFDEVFPDISPVKGKSTANCTSRFDSVPYDEQWQDMPNIAPVSPCFSDESSASSAAMSITGRFSDIEDKYFIDPRVLGSGHHGSVRECIDRNTGQRYAVKSIRKSDPAVKPGGLAREIMLLKEMKHHSIVHLVDVYEDTDYVHLVTDLCSGGELFDKIVDKSSNSDNGMPCFAEDEAARIMHQILTAVSYMHDNGVVHRDIKPENILFETTYDDSPIKIIDFGFARKHFANFGEPPMTTIVGTPYYISPDVLRKKYDKSCDLWSVGVISYILLCGYPPFNGANNDEVYDAVRRGRYRFPSDDWSYTSRESRDFIRRLLQKDPRKRMTVEQALNHPWILKNVSNVVEMSDEERQDTSSVEVVFHGLSRMDSIILPVSPPRRRVRTALFADL
jgi:serine/threonine protein kinase